MNTLCYLVSFVEPSSVVSKDFPSPSHRPFAPKRPPSSACLLPQAPLSLLSPLSLEAHAHFPGILGKERFAVFFFFFTILGTFQMLRTPFRASPPVLKAGRLCSPQFLHFSTLVKTLQDPPSFLDDSKLRLKDHLACFSVTPFHHPLCHQLCMCFHYCFYFAIL